MQELLAVDPEEPREVQQQQNFAKRCRASCHAKYPEMNYCVDAEEAVHAVGRSAAAVAAATKDAVRACAPPPVDIPTALTPCSARARAGELNPEPCTCDMPNVVPNLRSSRLLHDNAAVLGLARSFRRRCAAAALQYAGRLPDAVPAGPPYARPRRTRCARACAKCFVYDELSPDDPTQGSSRIRPISPSLSELHTPNELLRVDERRQDRRPR